MPLPPVSVKLKPLGERAVDLMKIDNQDGSTTRNGSVEVPYLVQGTLNAIDAMDAIYSKVPNSYGSWKFDRITQLDLTIWHTGTWDALVKYTSPELDAVDALRFSFSTIGAGSQHIIQSITTIQSYAESGTAPDHGRLIGVNEGEVAGCDLDVNGEFNFQLERTFSAGDVDLNYQKTVADISRCTNKSEFWGFAVGEVLFVGAEGGSEKGGLFTVRFSFARNKNRTDIEIGNLPTISKKGWEYLWTQNPQAEKGEGKNQDVSAFPKYAYVEQVYHEAEFGDLKLDDGIIVV